MTDLVLLTDYAWPDDSIERQVVEGAGFRMVCGPSAPAAPTVIDELARMHQPAAILTCWAQVTGAAIRSVPGLRIVARMGVGLDNIDVATATQQGVWVTNVPDYCVEEVSDHAVAFTLAWARGVVSFDRQVKAGQWNPAGAQLRRVSTLTCGIVGYGRIGRATARKLRAFGCRVLATNRSGRPAEEGVERVDLEELLRECDVVIVHAPLTAQTRHLIDRKALALMRRGGLLVNVSRGPVVDSDAVAEALAAGTLSCAALDVLESEPEVPAALRASPHTILTPHVAFSSDASLAELRTRAAQEVVRVLRGEAPRHPCNQPAASPATP